MLLWIVAACTVIACFFCSCGTGRQIPTKESVIEMREVVRDSIVVVPADSSLVRALIECDSTGKATVKQLLDMYAGARVLPPRIAIDAANVLTADCRVDSLAVYLVMKDRYYRSETAETKVVEVNRIRWWQRALMVMGVAFFIVIVIRLFR
jgi:hypothetical protein